MLKQRNQFYDNAPSSWVGHATKPLNVRNKVAPKPSHMKASSIILSGVVLGVAVGLALSFGLGV